MENANKNRISTKKLVLCAMLTALVVILQMMGAFIRLGPFQIALVLVPIVIGAATCGVGMTAWLGLVFGAVVLLNGDAAPFLTVNVLGTVATVLLKGVACAVAAALVYKLLARFNRYLAVIVAAVVCPIVNTGVFLLGCAVFFLDTITAWGIAEGYNGVVAYMFLGLVGGNFLVELASNVILSPVILRLLNIRRS
ncbi:MAG: ECF transporter S component [Clostridia bacterium]|nr:ECF transporter S component [Clostridia bacterium]